MSNSIVDMFKPTFVSIENKLNTLGAGQESNSKDLAEIKETVSNNSQGIKEILDLLHQKPELNSLESTVDNTKRQGELGRESNKINIDEKDVEFDIIEELNKIENESEREEALLNISPKLLRQYITLENKGNLFLLLPKNKKHTIKNTLESDFDQIKDMNRKTNGARKVNLGLKLFYEAYRQLGLNTEKLDNSNLVKSVKEFLSQI